MACSCCKLTSIADVVWRFATVLYDIPTTAVMHDAKTIKLCSLGCRDAQQASSRALDLQHDLQSLQADHARLAEESSLQHDLKLARHSLKQVC